MFWKRKKPEPAVIATCSHCGGKVHAPTRERGESWDDEAMQTKPAACSHARCGDCGATAPLPRMKMTERRRMWRPLGTESVRGRWRAEHTPYLRDNEPVDPLKSDASFTQRAEEGMWRLDVDAQLRRMARKTDQLEARLNEAMRPVPEKGANTALAPHEVAEAWAMAWGYRPGASVESDSFIASLAHLVSAQRAAGATVPRKPDLPDVSVAP